MSKVSKVPNTALWAKDQKACRRCRRCETLYCNTNKGSKGYVCRRCQKCIQGPQYRVMLLMPKVSKEDTHIFTHNFLNIQWIFNPQKVLESWDLGLSNHIKCYVCQSMSEVSKVKITFDTSDIDSIWWYGWKVLSLSFPKLFADWKSIEY